MIFFVSVFIFELVSHTYNVNQLNYNNVLIKKKIIQPFSHSGAKESLRLKVFF